MFKNYTKLLLITLSLPSIVVCPGDASSNLSENIADNFESENFGKESETFELDTRIFETVSYIMNNNITLCSKMFEDDEYWAFKAINGDHFSSEKERERAESIKNLKIIISTIAFGGTSFLHGLYESINTIFSKDVNELTAKDIENIFGILNSCIVYETISILHRRESDFNKYDCGINSADENALFCLYSDAFYTLWQRLVTLSNNQNNKIVDTIAQIIVQSGKVNSNLHYSYDYLKEYLRYDWNCYLTQYGVICDVADNLSVLQYLDVMRSSWRSLQLVGSTYLNNPKIDSGYSNVMQKAYAVLEQIENDREFQDSWKQSKKKYSAIPSKCKSLPIGQNKYNLVYIWHAISWCWLQNLKKDGKIPKNIFDLISLSVNSYKDKQLSILGVPYTEILKEYNVLYMLMEQIYDHANQNEEHHFDKNWFDLFFDNICALQDIYIPNRTNFEIKGDSIQDVIIDYAKVLTENKMSAQNSFKQYIDIDEWRSAPIYRSELDLEFFEYLLNVLFKIKQKIKGQDYWIYIERLKNLLHGRDFLKQYKIVNEFISRCNKINSDSLNCAEIQKILNDVETEYSLN